MELDEWKMSWLNCKLLQCQTHIGQGSIICFLGAKFLVTYTSNNPGMHFIST